MAVTATGSKFSYHNSLIFAAVCLAGAAWFGYDGWFGKYRQTELDKNNGKPTPNLYFNQYAPVPLAVLAIFSLISAIRTPAKKVIADENGLTISDKEVIPYSSIQQIDKRAFEKEGYFIIEYSQNNGVKKLKLSDRKYDNLALLLDEVIKQTGAKPADSV